MKSRKEKFKNKTSRTKLIIGTLVLSIGFGGSFSVAFADQDIQGMLSSWFNKQKTEAIVTIEQAISSEKEIQMQRLKDELRLEIQNAEKELNKFTEMEKEQRILALKSHTDELINNLQIDNSKEKEIIVSKLNKIMQDAFDKMEKEIDKNNKAGENAESINSRASEEISELMVNEGKE
jgi:hypothetical protein